MIGPNYWATGVEATLCENGQWSAEVKFFDDGFCQDGSTEGVIKARYLCDDIVGVCKLVVEDAKRLGIVFVDPMGNDQINLYLNGDGQNPNVVYPKNVRETMRVASAELGYRYMG